MMQGQDNREIALKFGLDRRGELRIEGYYLPKSGVSFTSDEINTAYLQASQECDELRQDPEASLLLQEFSTQVRSPGKDRIEQVYTFEQHLPTILGFTSRAGPDEDPTKRKLRTVHEFDQEKHCHQCTRNGLKDCRRRPRRISEKNPGKGVPVKGSSTSTLKYKL